MEYGSDIIPDCNSCANDTICNDNYIVSFILFLMKKKEILF